MAGAIGATPFCELKFPTLACRRGWSQQEARQAGRRQDGISEAPLGDYASEGVGFQSLPPPHFVPLAP